jgi:tight adherence protein B
MIVGAAVPFLFMAYKRSARLRLFEKSFPDALDSMARAIRAGNALSAAIQLVAEESPDPIGSEFRRVVEEIRLGLNPAEALFKLVERVPTEDIRFFCAAIRIQRGSGGNLAELLDRLSEVIRERYRILSHARVLSAQHKWSAICVGLSPLGFAIVIQLLNPGYFEPLLTSPVGAPLIIAGLVLEAVGFFAIWRIAQIKV